MWTSDTFPGRWGWTMNCRERVGNEVPTSVEKTKAEH